MKYYFIYVIIFIFYNYSKGVIKNNRNFTIEGDNFIKDGQPFRIISGSLHYWRSRSEDWKKHFELCKLMGLNTITTYINWALHEKEPGIFDFNGDLDIVKWIKTAQEVDLLVIVRIGPYITAEVDFGGFPYWLVNEKNIKIRTTDNIYLNLVERYLNHLLPLLKPLQYHYGGPIIDIQIEDDTDTDIPEYEVHKYYSWLRDIVRNQGIEVLLNTLAFPIPTECSAALTPGTWLALEFPYFTPVKLAFDLLRIYYPSGPIMVMEFYPSWFDCEGFPHQILDSTLFAESVDNILKNNGSINIYPIFGGTNFGFSNGAQHPGLLGGYRAVTTSYDFDAPINEAGDITEKFLAVRDVIAKYVKIPEIPLPPPSPKGSYGIIEMKEFVPLFELLNLFKSKSSINPIEMEKFGYGFGYILYSTKLHNFTSSAKLIIDSFQDRALIYLNNKFQGVLGWTEKFSPNSLILKPIQNDSSPILTIFIENKGRCSSELVDFSCARKGINGNVQLNNKILLNWKHYLLPMTNISFNQFKWLPYQGFVNDVPTFYRGKFTISDSIPLHTFLLTNGWNEIDNWGHGFVIINGFNLGRFSYLGPQRTLYVPASILKHGENEIFIFESDPPKNLLKKSKYFTNQYRIMSSISQQFWD